MGRRCGDIFYLAVPFSYAKLRLFYYFRNNLFGVDSLARADVANLCLFIDCIERAFYSLKYEILASFRVDILSSTEFENTGKVTKSKNINVFEHTAVFSLRWIKSVIKTVIYHLSERFII